MFSDIRILFLILNVILDLHEAEIIFKDDFNGDYRENWIALGAGQVGCTKQLDHTCNTDNEINLRTINGTLVLTAIHETYFDRFLTSAELVSRNVIEIDLDHNYLFRTKLSIPDEITLTVRMFLDSDKTQDIDIIPQVNLNYTDNFQIYEVEFTNDSLIWRKNNNFLSNSPRDRYLPRMYILKLSLKINEDHFKRISKSLPCSSFIVDYIELHRFKKSSKIQYNVYPTGTELSAQEICDNVNLLKSKARIRPSIIKQLDLIWSQEFDGNSLNQSDWYYEKTKDCKKQCYDNFGTINDPDGYLIVSNGTMKFMPKKLILNYLNLYQPSPSILVSKRCFKNVRIEIRAKRPRQTGSNGSNPGIACAMKLVGNKLVCDLLSETIGSLDIATMRSIFDEKSWPHELKEQNSIKKNNEHNNVTGIYQTGILGKEYNSQVIKNYVGVDENLDEFQIYGIEWNEFGVQWLFNGRVVAQANRRINEFGVPIEFDGKFPYDYPLAIRLEIGERASNDYKEHLTLGPPILEIDYIRVYGEKELVPVISLTPLNSTSYVAGSGSRSLITIISTALVVLLVISIVMFAMIVKLKMSAINETDEKYDDVNYVHSYELYDYGKDDEENEAYYANHYETIYNYKLSSGQINEYLEITTNEVVHYVNEQ